MKNPTIFERAALAAGYLNGKEVEVSAWLAGRRLARAQASLRESKNDAFVADARAALEQVQNYR